MTRISHLYEENIRNNDENHIVFSLISNRDSSRAFFLQKLAIIVVNSIMIQSFHI